MGVEYFNEARFGEIVLQDEDLVVVSHSTGRILVRYGHTIASAVLGRLRHRKQYQILTPVKLRLSL